MRSKLVRKKRKGQEEDVEKIRKGSVAEGEVSERGGC